jgi:hypothetical protein
MYPNTNNQLPTKKQKNTNQLTKINSINFSSIILNSNQHRTNHILSKEVEI